MNLFLQRAPSFRGSAGIIVGWALPLQSASTWTSKSAQNNGLTSQDREYRQYRVQIFGTFGGPGSEKSKTRSHAGIVDLCGQVAAAGGADILGSEDSALHATGTLRLAISTALSRHGDKRSMQLCCFRERRFVQMVSLPADAMKSADLRFRSTCESEVLFAAI